MDGQKQPSQSPPARSINQGNGQKYCPKCGAPMSSGRFCSNCGYNGLNQPTASEQQNRYAPQTSNPNKKWTIDKRDEKVIMVGVALIMVCVILVGILLSAMNDVGQYDDQPNGGSSSYVNQAGFNYNIEFTDKMFSGSSTSMQWTHPSNPGTQFAIVTLKVLNNGALTISTSPANWVFVSDGIVYRYSSNTFMDTVNSQTVQMMKGGSAVTEIVYEVPASVTSGSMVWDGWYNSAHKNYAYRDTNIAVNIPSSIDAPVAYSFRDGATISGGYSVKIDVNWTDVPSAGFYEIQTSNSSDFSTIKQIFSTRGNEVAITVTPAFLSYTGDYYIKVRAYDGWGRAVSDWSNVIACHLVLSI